MVVNTKKIIILLSLFTALTVNAAPTIGNGNDGIVVSDVPQTSVVDYLPEISYSSELSHFYFATIGEEILKPPVDFAYSEHVNAKDLPPIPATLFMVLTGFFCISLVKDRRIWLAGLAGILWMGQASIQVIPQLAVDISKRYIQRNSPADDVAYLYMFNDNRLRSDIEGTQYIGLLHHLAGIPYSNGGVSLPLQSYSLLQAQRGNLCESFRRALNKRSRNNSSGSQFAIADFSSLLNNAVICMAPKAMQHVNFSPAFIFDNLARGPPDIS